jgi:hypothetical protein
MSALSEKTVLLVTHQVDFLPIFDSILVGLCLSHDLCRTMIYIFFIGSCIYLSI